MNGFEAMTTAIAKPGRFIVITRKDLADRVADAIDRAYPEDRGRLGSEARIALTTYEGARLECDYCDVKPGHYEAIVKVGEPDSDDEPEIDF